MVQEHNDIKVEVVYALPDRAAVVTLNICKGITVGEAITTSGILDQFPEIDLQRNKVGIFSKPCNLDTPLMDGDRVEIYRPLKIDPKEARRRRAGKRKGKSRVL